ncbi:MAG: hypothetical protein KatS3mg055_2317 [Chloroflexus sp.]|uniref:DUF4349 domain-containing protein n=1 Tax=Chloroflexus sp. TaxID=1904827 RepID=UPI0021DDFD61|nr:DUF4349 domain-containing protein [Chloroflexus sp.]GIV89799.1 MAG: hypothetical protein KatS3mg055_2317 [Chloroflexus sp.]
MVRLLTVVVTAMLLLVGCSTEPPRKADFNGNTQRTSEEVVSAQAGGAAPAMAGAPAGGAAPAIVGRPAGEATSAVADMPAGEAGSIAADNTSGERGNTTGETNPLLYASRMVILNATLDIRVESVDQAEDRVRDIADRLGGYILHIRAQGREQSRESYITFRVPFENFERALTEIEGLAKEIVSRTVDGEDITEQYVDLQSRLRNLEATHDRIKALLESAQRLEDTLLLYQRLSEIQGQIEQIKGRMRYLEQNTNFSTISVIMRPVSVVEEKPEPTPTWDPWKIVVEQFGLLRAFGESILTIVLILAIWSPVWIIPVGILIWFWRRWHPAVYGEHQGKGISVRQPITTSVTPEEK